MIEIWKSLKDVVENGDNYEISNLGNVRNIKTNNTLKPIKLKNRNYLYVGFSLNGKVKRHYIHRLVGLAFINRLDDKNVINHKDGNPLNNNVENLEWCTQSENCQHAYDNKLNSLYGENHNYSKLTESKVKDIREKYGSGNYTLQNLADEYGVDMSNIGKIVRCEIWKHVE